MNQKRITLDMWLKEQIDECLNEIEFDISSQIKDVEQQITGKKEDA